MYISEMHSRNRNVFRHVQRSYGLDRESPKIQEEKRCRAPSLWYPHLQSLTTSIALAGLGIELDILGR